jgi:hypothetical protein
MKEQKSRALTKKNAVTDDIVVVAVAAVGEIMNEQK